MVINSLIYSASDFQDTLCGIQTLPLQGQAEESCSPHFTDKEAELGRLSHQGLEAVEMSVRLWR